MWLRPAFARRVCFSLSSFILAVRTFPPRGDAESCSGSVSPCFPEDVAASRCFEVLSDCKKKKKEEGIRLPPSERVYICRFVPLRSLTFIFIWSLFIGAEQTGIKMWMLRWSSRRSSGLNI